MASFGDYAGSMRMTAGNLTGGSGTISFTDTGVYVPSLYTSNITIAGGSTLVNLTSEEVFIEDKNLVLASNSSLDSVNSVGGTNSIITFGEEHGSNSTSMVVHKDQVEFSSPSGNINVVADTFEGDLTGNVTGTVSSLDNHTTGNLTEGGSNLYFTDARARTAMSATNTDITLSSNRTAELSYDNSTGRYTLKRSKLKAGSNVTFTNINGEITINSSYTDTDTTYSAGTGLDLDGTTFSLTSRTIGGVEFDGSQNINLPGVNTPGNQNTSGNAATATQLQTTRTIGGVSFDGSANIDLPGVNTPGVVDTSGTAAFASAAEANSALANVVSGLSGDGSSYTGNVTGTVSDISNHIGNSTIELDSQDNLSVIVDTSRALANDASGVYVKFDNSTIILDNYGSLKANLSSIVTNVTAGDNVSILGSGTPDDGYVINIPQNVSTTSDLTFNNVTVSSSLFAGVRDGDNITLVVAENTVSMDIKDAGEFVVAVGEGENGDAFKVDENSTAVGGKFLVNAGADTDPAAALDVFQIDGASGDVDMYKGNLTVHSGDVTMHAGNLTVTGEVTAQAFNSESDERLKTNIVELEDALNKVKEMRGVRYNWRAEDRSDAEVGVIAQEVHAQYPEITSNNEAGFLTVDYSRLTAVLIQAVKELEARVVALEAKE